MTLIRFTGSLIILGLLTSCDPIHDLKLENQTTGTIEVIYYPALDKSKIKNKDVEKVVIQGQEMNKLILDSSETINIGTVVARYTPSVNDIDLEYLEVRSGNDTLRLNGNNAIFSTIQKVNRLDWRMIIK